MAIEDENFYCGCKKTHRRCKRIVITGGPGAGKTAVLEMARKEFCDHVAILPESAGIIFGGGFFRRSTEPARCAAQRAIFHVQHELEAAIIGEKKFAVALCDRGSLDSLAYWPKAKSLFFRQLNTTKDAELSRYDLVIHLRTPTKAGGYHRQNPLRIENAEEAMLIDKEIAKVWQKHPHKYVIESTVDFLEKASMALSIIGKNIPKCCM